jgi:hypothetical protein
LTPRTLQFSKLKPLSMAPSMDLVRCCAVSTATSLTTDSTWQSSCSDRPKPKMKSTLPLK